DRLELVRRFEERLEGDVLAAENLPLAEAGGSIGWTTADGNQPIVGGRELQSLQIQLIDTMGHLPFCCGNPQTESLVLSQRGQERAAMVERNCGNSLFMSWQLFHRFVGAVGVPEVHE